MAFALLDHIEEKTTIDEILTGTFRERDRQINFAIEELEKVRIKIIKKANSGQWAEPTIYGMQKAVFIIDNELSELKGE